MITVADHLDWRTRHVEAGPARILPALRADLDLAVVAEYQSVRPRHPRCGGDLGIMADEGCLDSPHPANGRAPEHDGVLGLTAAPSLAQVLRDGALPRYDDRASHAAWLRAQALPFPS